MQPRRFPISGQFRSTFAHATIPQFSSSYLIGGPLNDGERDEVQDNQGNWERVRKGVVEVRLGKEFLRYELRDGTIGLKRPGTWREVMDVHF